MEDKSKVVFKIAAYVTIIVGVLSVVIFITGKPDLKSLIQSTMQPTVASNNQTDMTNDNNTTLETVQTYSNTPENTFDDALQSDVQISKGETYELVADGIISGDIIIGDQRLFDSEKNTALIVECKKGTIINAPYGCLVSYDNDLERMIAHVVGEGFSRENITILEWN